MTFERKVTAVRFGPDEIETLLSVFELARIKIQDVDREVNQFGLDRQHKVQAASRCGGLSVDQLFKVQRLLQETFDRAEEARLT